MVGCKVAGNLQDGLPSNPTNTWVGGVTAIRRVILLFTALLMIAFVLGQAAPALAAPELVVEAGFQGYAPWLAWMPVRVVVWNPDTEEFTGTLEVRDLTRNQVVLSRTQPLQVPPGSSRAMVFWVPSAPDLSHDVRLLQEGRPLVERAATARSINPGTATVGFLGDRLPPYLTVLPQPHGSVPAQVIDLDPELLPRQSSAWFGFHALIIDGSSGLRRLDAEQLRALRQWVELGGVLFLGTGADAAAMAEFLGPDVFPWKVAGTTRITTYDQATDLARRVNPEVPGVPGDAPPSVAAILEPGRRDDLEPWSYHADVGLGRVYAWAARLDAEPWLSWVGSSAAVGALLGPELQTSLQGIVQAGQVVVRGRLGLSTSVAVPARPVARSLPAASPAVPGRVTFDVRQLGVGQPGGYSYLAPGGLQEAASDLPSLQLPRPPVILLAVLGYLVIVGPLSFWVLGRGGRRHWAWATVPAVALLIVASTYSLSFARFTTTDQQAAGVLVMPPGRPFGVWTGAVAAYRPAGTTSVNLGASVAVASTGDNQYRGPWLPGSPASDDRAIMTLNPAPGGVDVRWPRRTPGIVPTARVEVDVPLAGAIDARLRVVEDELVLSVANGLDITLYEPQVLSNYNILTTLQDLEPGATAEATMTHTSWTLPSNMISIWSYGTPPGSLSTDEARRLRQRARLLRYVSGAAGGSQGPHTEPVLVAWIDGTPAVLADSQAPGGWSSGGTTVVVVPLALELDGETGFTVSSTLVPVEVVEVDAPSTHIGAGGEVLLDEGGSVTYDWRLPPWSGPGQPQVLEVDPGAPVTVEAFDAVAGQWVVLGSGRVRVEAPQLDGLLDQGRLRFRLTTQGTTALTPDLQLSVAPAGPGAPGGDDR